MSGVRRIFGWIVRTAAIAGLIAFTVLLVWAFESRQMPALGTWHTLPLTGELSTRGATAQGTLQDYLDQEERLFRELRVNIYDRLDALSDPGLPPPDRVLLFSPEIGIAPFSAIADSHKLLSFLTYFAQFKWLSIQPEYDPFKDNSFPKNAGQQAYEITAALTRQLEETRKAGKLADFPPVLAFLSWVDATVETLATIDRLYGQLENRGNELVIFDVNRFRNALFYVNLR